MDLAKIRKKSLLAQAEQQGDERHYSSVTSSELVKVTLDTIPTVPDSSLENNLHKELCPKQIESIGSAPPSIFATPHESVAVCSPMEAILAGRNAAGCDDESIIADDVAGETFTVSCLEFLCFRVSDETYGINIMDIKEIIKPREVTEVPRAPAFVSGVISLRGTIIPIIDMRFRLGLTREEPTGKERIVVIKNNNSFSGLMVDEVIQVVQVQLDAVEAAPTVLDGIDRDFVSGLGRSDGRLIIILNLENIADINLY